MIAPTATATTHGRATTYPNAAQAAINTISVIMPSVPGNLDRSADAAPCVRSSTRLARAGRSCSAKAPASGAWLDGPLASALDDQRKPTWRLLVLDASSSVMRLAPVAARCSVGRFALAGAGFARYRVCPKGKLT